MHKSSDQFPFPMVDLDLAESHLESEVEGGMGDAPRKWGRFRVLSQSLLDSNALH